MEKSKDARAKTAEPNKDLEGFLPFHTNAFDRVFIGVMLLIGIHLLWLRFMEHILPIGVAVNDIDIAGDIVLRCEEGLSLLGSRDPRST